MGVDWGRGQAVGGSGRAVELGVVEGWTKKMRRQRQTGRDRGASSRAHSTHTWH